MSGIIKEVEFPSGISCSYWVISQFNINLEARNIETKCKAYKDKQAFLDNRPPVDTVSITIDTGFYDQAITDLAANNFNPEVMYYNILNSIDMFKGNVEIE